MSRRDLVVRIPKAMAARLAVAALELEMEPGRGLVLALVEDRLREMEAEARARSLHVCLACSSNHDPRKSCGAA